MRKLTIGVLSGLLVIGMTTPALALEGDTSSDSSSSSASGVQSRVNEANQEAREKVKSAREDLEKKRAEAKSLIADQKTQIQEKRTELEQKVEQSRTERKAALKEKRLELCKEREAKINELISSSAKVGSERLARIQAIEARVIEFYEREALVSTEYDAAAALVDEKESSAVAAVEVVESQRFECSKVDGNNPSGELKTLHTAKREALDSYRDSVKQLVQIVKAARQAKSAEGSAS